MSLTVWELHTFKMFMRIWLDHQLHVHSGDLISVIQKMPSAGSGAFGMQSFGVSTKQLPYSSSTTMKERCS